MRGINPKARWLVALAAVLALSLPAADAFGQSRRSKSTRQSVKRSRGGGSTKSPTRGGVGTPVAGAASAKRAACVATAHATECFAIDGASPQADASSLCCAAGQVVEWPLRRSAFLGQASLASVAAAEQPAVARIVREDQAEPSHSLARRRAPARPFGGASRHDAKRFRQGPWGDPATIGRTFASNGNPFATVCDARDGAQRRDSRSAFRGGRGSRRRSHDSGRPLEPIDTVNRVVHPRFADRSPGS